eukprot:14102986-Alexandrium_andersonii.AAC.1
MPQRRPVSFGSDRDTEPLAVSELPARGSSTSTSHGSRCFLLEVLRSETLLLRERVRFGNIT